MSVKALYNGFKFKSSEFTDIHRWIMEWRTELSVLHKAALSKLIATLSVSMIDRAAITPGTNAGKSPLIDTWGSVLDMQKEVKTKGIRNPLVDFEFSICLFPFEGSVYGIVYTERQDWLSMWLEKDFVEEFAYWNSGDRPEEYTEEEWNSRYEIWMSILEQGSHRVPAMCGFNADCTHEYEHPTSEEVLAAVPSFAERVREQARLRVMSEELSRRRDERQASMTEEEKQGRPAEVFAMVTDVERWLKTPEGDVELQAMIARLSSILKSELTRDDLVRDLPTVSEAEA